MALKYVSLVVDDGIVKAVMPVVPINAPSFILFTYQLRVLMEMYLKIPTTGDQKQDNTVLKHSSMVEHLKWY